MRRDRLTFAMMVGIPLMQLTLFGYAISCPILMSGFMFPFKGMPQWAQVLGEILPLTHFLRIVRGVMLIGNGCAEAAPKLRPLVIFLLAVATLAVTPCQRTLD